MGFKADDICRHGDSFFIRGHVTEKQVMRVLRTNEVKYGLKNIVIEHLEPVEGYWIFQSIWEDDQFIEKAGEQQWTKVQLR